MPIGLRGVGKTVLLNRFETIARDEGLRVAFIEAPESGDFRRLLATRVRALLDLDSGPVSRVVKRALGTLKSFTYNLPDGTSISIDVDPLRGSGAPVCCRRTSPICSWPRAKPRVIVARACRSSTSSSGGRCPRTRSVGR